MCLENRFNEFEQALTDDEKNAIKAWLGVRYEAIRTYQQTGVGDATVVQFERNLNTALAKAVICQKTVYRGLSAGNWRPDAIKYIRTILVGPETFKLPCHDSASVIESIGRAFTFTESDDEERHLAVLLKVQPKTARYLAPFQHEAKHEDEVVLLHETEYRRASAKRMSNPKPNLELWELELEEVV